MSVKFLPSLMLSALALVFSCHAGDSMPKNFTGGKSDAVKSWGTKTLEQIKSSPGAYVIYICDDARKNNHFAYHFESKEVLGADEVKTALAKFTKVKIKASDAKSGFPEAWLKDAQSGATLVIMTSDMQAKVFDKSVPQAETTAAVIAATAKSMGAHGEELTKQAKARDQEKKREADEKAKLAEANAKKEREKAMAEGKVGDVKDLGIAALDKRDDPKKKPDPKNPKKDEKKPADGKPADPKDPKKKLPDDE